MQCPQRMWLIVALAMLAVAGCGGGNSSGADHPSTAPPAPSGLSAASANAQVVLTWNAVTGASSYNIYRNSALAGTASGATFTDTGLTNGTTYTYQVSAINTAGEGSKSSVVTATPQAPPPPNQPATPTGLAAASGNAQVALTWNPVSGASSYNVYRNSTLVGTAHSVAFTDTGLTNGTTYTYQVSAVNAAGEGSRSNPTTATPQALAPSGWPDGTNTGYRNAPGYVGLTDYSSTAVAGQECSGPIASNMTYHFCNFPDGLAIPSSLTNVTFYGSRFQSNAVADANVPVYGDNITFDYCSFEPSKAASPPVTFNNGYQYGIDQRGNGQITIDHSDFWGWGNGIQFGFSSQAKPFVVRNSWFHDARNDGGLDHTDAILENYGGQSYMVFDHNRIVSVGNTNGLALQAGNHVPYDHITVTQNYVSGFGYTLNVGGNGYLTNSVVTGNTFGTDIQPAFGPLYGWGGTGGNTWRGNKWHVVPGSYYSPAADDGKYWWPDGTLSTVDYSGP